MADNSGLDRFLNRVYGLDIPDQEQTTPNPLTIKADDVDFGLDPRPNSPHPPGPPTGTPYQYLPPRPENVPASDILTKKAEELEKLFGGQTGLTIRMEQGVDLGEGGVQDAIYIEQKGRYKNSRSERYYLTHDAESGRFGFVNYLNRSNVNVVADVMTDNGIMRQGDVVNQIVGNQLTPEGRNASFWEKLQGHGSMNVNFGSLTSQMKSQLTDLMYLGTGSNQTILDRVHKARELGSDIYRRRNSFHAYGIASTLAGMFPQRQNETGETEYAMNKIKRLQIQGIGGTATTAYSGVGQRMEEFNSTVKLQGAGSFDKGTVSRRMFDLEKLARIEGQVEGVQTLGGRHNTRIISAEQAERLAVGQVYGGKGMQIGEGYSHAGGIRDFGDIIGLPGHHPGATSIEGLKQLESGEYELRYTNYSDKVAMKFRDKGELMAVTRDRLNQATGGANVDYISALSDTKDTPMLAYNALIAEKGGSVSEFRDWFSTYAQGQYKAWEESGFSDDSQFSAIRNITSQLGEREGKQKWDKRNFGGKKRWNELITDEGDIQSVAQELVLQGATENLLSKAELFTTENEHVGRQALQTYMQGTLDDVVQGYEARYADTSLSRRDRAQARLDRMRINAARQSDDMNVINEAFMQYGNVAEEGYERISGITGRKYNAESGQYENLMGDNVDLNEADSFRLGSYTRYGIETDFINQVRSEGRRPDMIMKAESQEWLTQANPGLGQALENMYAAGELRTNAFELTRAERANRSAGTRDVIEQEDAVQAFDKDLFKSIASEEQNLAENQADYMRRVLNRYGEETGGRSMTINTKKRKVFLPNAGAAASTMVEGGDGTALPGVGESLFHAMQAASQYEEGDEESRRRRDMAVYGATEQLAKYVDQTGVRAESTAYDLENLGGKAQGLQGLKGNQIIMSLEAASKASGMTHEELRAMTGQKGDDEGRKLTLSTIRNPMAQPAYAGSSLEILWYEDEKKKRNQLLQGIENPGDNFYMSQDAMQAQQGDFDADEIRGILNYRKDRTGKIVGYNTDVISSAELRRQSKQLTYSEWTKQREEHSSRTSFGAFRDKVMQGLSLPGSEKGSIWKTAKQAEEQFISQEEIGAGKIGIMYQTFLRGERMQALEGARQTSGVDSGYYKKRSESAGSLAHALFQTPLDLEKINDPAIDSVTALYNDLFINKDKYGKLSFSMRGSGGRQETSLGGLARTAVIDYMTMGKEVQGISEEEWMEKLAAPSMANLLPDDVGARLFEEGGEEAYDERINQLVEDVYKPVREGASWGDVEKRFLELTERKDMEDYAGVPKNRRNAFSLSAVMRGMFGNAGMRSKDWQDGGDDWGNIRAAMESSKEINDFAKAASAKAAGGPETLFNALRSGMFRIGEKILGAFGAGTSPEESGAQFLEKLKPNAMKVREEGGVQYLEDERGRQNIYPGSVHEDKPENPISVAMSSYGSVLTGKNEREQDTLALIQNSIPRQRREEVATELTKGDDPALSRATAEANYLYGEGGGGNKQLYMDLGNEIEDRVMQKLHGTRDKKKLQDRGLGQISVTNKKRTSSEGFIDAMMIGPDGKAIVTDIKTKTDNSIQKDLISSGTLNDDTGMVEPRIMTQLGLYHEGMIEKAGKDKGRVIVDGEKVELNTEWAAVLAMSSTALTDPDTGLPYAKDKYGNISDDDLKRSRDEANKLIDTFYSQEKAPEGYQGGQALWEKERAMRQSYVDQQNAAGEDIQPLRFVHTSQMQSAVESASAIYERNEPNILPAGKNVTRNRLPSVSGIAAAIVDTVKRGNPFRPPAIKPAAGASPAEQGGATLSPSQDDTWYERNQKAQMLDAEIEKQQVRVNEATNDASKEFNQLALNELKERREALNIGGDTSGNMPRPPEKKPAAPTTPPPSSASPSSTPPSDDGSGGKQSGPQGLLRYLDEVERHYEREEDGERKTLTKKMPLHSIEKEDAMMAGLGFSPTELGTSGGGPGVGGGQQYYDKPPALRSEGKIVAGFQSLEAMQQAVESGDIESMSRADYEKHMRNIAALEGMEGRQNTLKTGQGKREDTFYKEERDKREVSLAADLDSVKNATRPHLEAIMANESKSGSAHPDAKGLTRAEAAAEALSKMAGSISKVAEETENLSTIQQDHLETIKNTSKAWTDMEAQAKKLEKLGDKRTPEEQAVYEKIQAVKEAVGDDAKKLLDKAAKMDYGEVGVQGWANDAERQERLSGALLQGGRAGRAARRKAFEQGGVGEGGLEIAGLNIQNEGALRALGGFARGASRIRSGMWGMRQIGRQIIDPMMQQAQEYQQYELMRMQGMVAGGSISSADMAQSANVQAIQAQQASLATMRREAGSVVNATMMSLVPDDPLAARSLGRFQGGLETIGGAASAGAIAGSVFGGPIGAAIGFGAGVVGGTAAYIGGQINDSNQLAQSFNSRGDILGDISLDVAQILNPEAAEEGSRLAEIERVSMYSSGLMTQDEFRGMSARANVKESGGGVKGAAEAVLMSGVLGQRIEALAAEQDITRKSDPIYSEEEAFAESLRGKSTKQRLSAYRERYGDEFSDAEYISRDQRSFTAAWEQAGLSSAQQAGLWAFSEQWFGDKGKDDPLIRSMVEKMASGSVDTSSLQQAALQRVESQGESVTNISAVQNAIEGILSEIGSGEEQGVASVVTQMRQQVTSTRNKAVNAARGLAGRNLRSDNFYGTGSGRENWTTAQMDAQDMLESTVFNAQWQASDWGKRLETGGFMGRVDEMIAGGDAAGATRATNTMSGFQSRYDQGVLYGQNRNTMFESGMNYTFNFNRQDRQLIDAMAGGDKLALAQNWRMLMNGPNRMSASQAIRVQTMDAETGMNAFQDNVTDLEQQWINESAILSGQSDLLNDRTRGKGTTQIRTEMRQMQYGMADYQYEMATAQRNIGWQMQTGGSKGVDAQGFAKIGDNLEELVKLFKDQGMVLQTGNGMGMWQIQDTQTRLQREQAAWSIEQQGKGLGLQQEQFELAGRQFYEKWNFGQEKFQYNTQYQQGMMTFQRNQQLTQRQWQQEDLDYGRNKAELGFAWQTEDFDRNIRYARGRERRDLMRQRERAVVSHAMEMGRADTQQQRFGQSSEWADELFEKQKDHFNQQTKFTQEQMEMQKRHFEESRALQEEQMNMTKENFEKQKQWQQEQWELEDQQRLLQRQHQELQMEMQTEMAERSRDTELAMRDYNAGLQVQTDALQRAEAQTQMWVQKLEIFNNLTEAGTSNVSDLAGSVTSTLQKVSSGVSSVFKNIGGSISSLFGFGSAEGGYIDASYMQSSASKATQASIMSFAVGGYTGDGGKHTPAGIVHKGEYVVPQNGSLVVRGGMQEDYLKEMVRLLRKIVDMGPGRVNATIHTNERSVPTSQLTTYDRVMGAV